MIVIIDYGVGNLFSLQSSLKAVGATVCVSGDPAVIHAADRLILPGVGAFGDAADKLRNSGLAEVIKAEVGIGKPLLGICLGMQLLFDRSEEYGDHAGLGLIPGEVVAMKGRLPAGLMIPHIGWNSLHLTKETPLFRYLTEGDCVYFVHSYFATRCDAAVVATAEYGLPLTAAVQRGNVFGCQFHPEKSGTVGLSILRAFCEEGKMQ